MAVDGFGSDEVGESLAAGMDGAALAEGDHLLDQWLGGLALGHRGFDAGIENDGGDEISEDGAAVAGITT